MRGFRSMPTTTSAPTLSIVVPVYNEVETLPRILGEVVMHGPRVKTEIIVVDDGSTDGTRDWLRSFLAVEEERGVAVDVDPNGRLCLASQTAPQPHAVLLRIKLQASNQGKGAALRAGFEMARHDVIVIQDADLEYDPRDLPRMFSLIAERGADVVYGSRFYGQPHRSLYLHHYLGNWLISRLINVLCNATLSDIEVCYKMFRRDVLNGMSLRCDDFGFEVEFTVKMLRARKWSVYEIGISYYGRTYDEGKKIGWRDGLKALWYIIRFRISA